MLEEIPARSRVFIDSNIFIYHFLDLSEDCSKQLEVRARIETLHAFSAHAGRREILEWLRALKKFPAQVFLNHGEPHAAGALAKAIKREFGAEAITAKTGESYQLG